MSYPVLADLTALFTGVGITLNGSYPAGDDLAVAIEWWEENTGYTPFWTASDAAELTLKFDPPGPQRGRGPSYRAGGGEILLLNVGFVSISDIKIAVTTDNPGTSLVADQQFFTQPYDAARKHRPITRIEFLTAVYGPPKSVAITGLVGFSTVLPTLAKQGILKRAGGTILRGLREGKGGAILEWSEGDITEKKSQGLLAGWGDSWYSDAFRALEQFRLLH